MRFVENICLMNLEVLDLKVLTVTARLYQRMGRLNDFWSYNKTGDW